MTAKLKVTGVDRRQMPQVAIQLREILTSRDSDVRCQLPVGNRVLQQLAAAMLGALESPPDVSVFKIGFKEVPRLRETIRTA